MLATDFKRIMGDEDFIRRPVCSVPFVRLMSVRFLSQPNALALDGNPGHYGFGCDGIEFEVQPPVGHLHGGDSAAYLSLPFT